MNLNTASAKVLELLPGVGESLASRIAGDFVSFGRVRPLEERLAGIRAVTAEDVQRVARAWLVPERRSVVHVVAPPAGQGDVAPPAGPGAR